MDEHGQRFNIFCPGPSARREIQFRYFLNIIYSLNATWCLSQKSLNINPFKPKLTNNWFILLYGQGSQLENQTWIIKSITTGLTLFTWSPLDLHCLHGHHWTYIVYMVTTGLTLFTWSPLDLHCLHGHHWTYIVYMVTTRLTLFTWSPLAGWFTDDFFCDRTLPFTVCKIRQNI